MGGLSQLQQTDDKHKLCCFIPTSIPFFLSNVRRERRSNKSTADRRRHPIKRLCVKLCPAARHLMERSPGVRGRVNISTPPPPGQMDHESNGRRISKSHAQLPTRKKYPGWRGWESPRRGDRRENSTELLNTSFPRSQWQWAAVCTTTPNSNKGDTQFRQFLTANYDD